MTRKELALRLKKLLPVPKVCVVKDVTEEEIDELWQRLILFPN